MSVFARKKVSAVNTYQVTFAMWMTFINLASFAIVSLNSGLSVASAPKRGSNTTPKLEATVNFYAFENQGTSVSESYPLTHPALTLPFKTAWFDWNCSAVMQSDGVTVSCGRNGEAVEFKTECSAQKRSNSQTIRVSKEQNFVMIEAQCTLPAPRQRIARKKPTPPADPKPGVSTEQLDQLLQMKEQPDAGMQSPALPVSPAPMPGPNTNTPPAAPPPAPGIQNPPASP